MQQTIKNLAAAFVGESQARNRYTMYAKIAAKEGYEKIAEVFRATADQEREHASWLFKIINQLKDGQSEFEEIKVEAGVPTTYGTTTDNLKAAIAGENHEHTSMYPEFANIADSEGLTDIATRLRAIAKAEEHHEERYSKILTQLEAGTFFQKGKDVEWVCRECGYVHVGTTPPDVCPSCSHTKSFYELKVEEF